MHYGGRVKIASPGISCGFSRINKIRTDLCTVGGPRGDQDLLPRFSHRQSNRAPMAPCWRWAACGDKRNLKCRACHIVPGFLCRVKLIRKWRSGVAAVPMLGIVKCLLQAARGDPASRQRAGSKRRRSRPTEEVGAISATRRCCRVDS